MKVMRKRLPAILLILLLAAAILPTAAFAAGKIDLTEPETLTIIFRKEGTAVPGVQFDLYKVAAVDEFARMTLMDEFAPYLDTVTGLGALDEQNEDSWQEMAETLKNCLKPETVPIKSDKTNDDGEREFSELEPGLYLVVGSRQTVGSYIYTVAPFMVFLPGADYENNAWVYTYAAEVEPKAERQFIPPPEEKLTRKVLKVWDDDGHEEERPEEVTVTLLQDGSEYETVTLNAGNNWRYTWTDLKASSEWTLTEADVENYTMQIEQDGVTFVVTNTYAPPEPPPAPDKPGPEDPTPERPPMPSKPPEDAEYLIDDPEVPLGYWEWSEENEEWEWIEDPDVPLGNLLPQTGVLWWPVPVMLCLGIILLTVGTLCRRRDEK